MIKQKTRAISEIMLLPFCDIPVKAGNNQMDSLIQEKISSQNRSASLNNANGRL